MCTAGEVVVMRSAIIVPRSAACCMSFIGVSICNSATAKRNRSEQALIPDEQAVFHEMISALTFLWLAFAVQPMAACLPSAEPPPGRSIWISEGELGKRHRLVISRSVEKAGFAPCYGKIAQVGQTFVSLAANKDSNGGAAFCCRRLTRRRIAASASAYRRRRGPRFSAMQQAQLWMRVDRKDNQAASSINVGPADQNERWQDYEIVGTWPRMPSRSPSA